MKFTLNANIEIKKLLRITAKILKKSLYSANKSGYPMKKKEKDVAKDNR